MQGSRIESEARAVSEVRAKYLGLGRALAEPDRNKRVKHVHRSATSLLAALRSFIEQDLSIGVSPSTRADGDSVALRDETMREHLADARELTALIEAGGILEAVRVRAPLLVAPIGDLLPKTLSKLRAHRATLAFILGEADYRELGFDPGIPAPVSPGTKVPAVLVDLSDLLA